MGSVPGSERLLGTIRPERLKDRFISLRRFRTAAEPASQVCESNENLQDNQSPAWNLKDPPLSLLLSTSSNPRRPHSLSSSRLFEPILAFVRFTENTVTRLERILLFCASRPPFVHQRTPPLTILHVRPYSPRGFRRPSKSSPAPKKQEATQRIFAFTSVSRESTQKSWKIKKNRGPRLSRNRAGTGPVLPRRPRE